MNTEGLIAAAAGLVKGLQGRINGGGMDLQEAEAKILEMVNWIGDEMVQEVVAGLAEPTSANQITVGGEVAVFERVRNLRFINRFGEEVVHPRRCYRYRSGGVAPLDVKLGIDGCFGFGWDNEPTDQGTGRHYRPSQLAGTDLLQGVQLGGHREALWREGGGPLDRCTLRTEV
ncbi:MAG: hypothetical protein OXP69_13915 [Spirochaetaceae bacterium]|nr:hypothetical protein [Spirochaetaceae bacterium]